MTLIICTKILEDQILYKILNSALIERLRLASIIERVPVWSGQLTNRSMIMSYRRTGLGEKTCKWHFRSCHLWQGFM